MWQLWSVMLNCEQGDLHPLPQESDWSNEDWDSAKAKVRKQNKSLIDSNDPKPQTNTEQIMDIDEVAFSKLQIGQSDPKEELLEVMKSLIPPEEATENTNREELLEEDKRLQREEEKYELYYRIYVGQLSNKEESNTDTDGSTDTYFG